MKFKTSSGIKSIVGRDLITDRYIAIFELVKNSYDARATEVIVSFNTSEDSENGIGNLKDGKIYIVDNGKGMSKDDLENKWLFLAYSDKKEGHSDQDSLTDLEDGLRQIKHRTYVGSKGIGRFSSDSLGGTITIKTKIASENIEHQLTVNWDDFDISLNKKFEDIAVKYKYTDQISRKNYKNYTIIEISDLRENWDEAQIKGVVEKLKRLKNPFLEQDDLIIYCGVNIFNLQNNFLPNKEYLVKSNIAEVLQEKSINVTATISKNHSKIILKDRGALVYSISNEEKSILRNVDNITISINYLTRSAKSTFTRRMSVEPINYGNIFIYRNGFHVSPYGETHYDIFGLNMRKGQGYKRYIATRELIGFISIEDSHNLFKETSSRNNGFVENGYFKALERFYMMHIHRPLEKYIHLIQWGEDKETKEELTLSNIQVSDSEKDNFKKYLLQDGFLLNEFNESLDFEKNKPEKIIDRFLEATDSPLEIQTNRNKIQQDIKKLDNQFKVLQHENLENRKIIKKAEEKAEILEKQNRNLNNKRSEQSYNEQITHHFKKLSLRLRDSVQELELLKEYIPKAELKKFNLAVRKIVRTQQELIAFQDLLTKTTIETRKNTKLNWIELFKWYFDDKSNEKPIVNIIFDNDIVFNNWNIGNTIAVEIIMMLGNLYENAKEHGASMLDFVFTEDHLIVSSDSNPISEEFLDSIFELGFTTKKNGTGIGLNQVQMFLKKYTMNIQARNKNGMVEFIIKKQGK